ncbi:predicted protein [Aspergillus terreus NIH2624]|uniref:Transaldolase n=1 Tax=Aspergillus terreus (strain NIH 2624 / FGSC A1156) TaxID=341663 RepID=Q0CPZ6_ASPTN|nr:uncharacterized protein ATEG_04238 [Aspergillus terreus NIH2624]EAU36040.1 predicted protein [Aspergillus terreus NIH2624]
MVASTLLDRLQKVCNVDVDDASVELIKSLPFKPYNQTSNQHIITEELLKPSNRTLLTELAAKYGKQGWETAVEFCARILPFITGRVLVQISPRVINDSAAIIRQCERFAEYFHEKDVPLSRFAIKLPFSGSAAAAAAELNSRGIRTLATAVFSLEQAIAASQSNCLFISPYFNEIAAHFDNSLQPETTDVALEHPMSATILQILETFARVYETTGKEQPVMVIASHLNTAEVLAMAELGCQHVTVSAPNLRKLQETPDVLPPIEKVNRVHPYAAFDVPQRLRALISKDPLGGTRSDGSLASMKTDYLASGGQKLDSFIQTDRAVRKKFEDARRFFLDAEARAEEVIENEIAMASG